MKFKIVRTERTRVVYYVDARDAEEAENLFFEGSPNIEVGDVDDLDGEIESIEAVAEDAR